MITTKSKYKLGGCDFRTWEEVHAKAKSILAKGKRNLNSDEQAFILDLLEYHPHARKKKHGGIDRVIVGLPEYGYGSCFRLVRPDGSEVDFSYKKCVATTKKDRKKAIANNEKQERLKAYRQAVEVQTLEYRSRMDANSCCVFCGSQNELEIDHSDPTFIELVNGFEQHFRPEKYPPLEQVQSLNPIRFKQTRKAYKQFISGWLEYHQIHAQYQILCGSCNNRKQKGTRYSPFIKPSDSTNAVHCPVR